MAFVSAITKAVSAVIAITCQPGAQQIPGAPDESIGTTLNDRA